jgi:hypothetical protein
MLASATDATRRPGHGGCMHPHVRNAVLPAALFALAAFLAILACLATLALVPPAGAAAAPPANPGAAADSAYAHQDWAAAERGYERVVKANPSDWRAWFRLGVASGSQGHWPRAIEAYRIADASGAVPPRFARYNLACAFARSGQPDSALATLQRLVAAGYRQVDPLANDPDLASVRSDPRFAAVLARAKHNVEPCSDTPESRQFDFWIGDWNVTSNLNGGAQAGRSHVELILGQCVIFENWSTPNGSGKSFNAWNADLGCWQQNWMDDTGDVTNYTDGHFTDAAMRFRADKKDGAGKWQKHRLTFFPLGPDEVRQLGEHSDDGGANWVVDYDLDYRRTPPPAAGR